MKKRPLLVGILILICVGGGAYGAKSLFNLEYRLPYLAWRRSPRQWSIGIYRGTNPLDFAPPLGFSNPVISARDITDARTTFVADPFMLQENGAWYMFFEVGDDETGEGKIGLATSTDACRWEYRGIVLDEPFRLSYPYVFKHDNCFYLLPETRAAAEVRLYQAVDFPRKWRLVKTLLRGDWADPSLIKFGGKWWLFALRGWDNLCLFYADDLVGPWTEHPRSPLVTNDESRSRPGGRIIVYAGQPLRYAQDGTHFYGNRLRAFLIDTLTLTDYQEHEAIPHPILTGSGHGWNAEGMHHLDPHRISDSGWIASVDGFPKRKKHLIFGWR